jgi:hypothetical protein
MTLEVRQILRQAATLSPDDQLELAAKLIERARQKTAQQAVRHAWLAAIGAAPYPLTGEDAQAWVSRTRQEGAEAREQQWRS